MRNKGSCNSLYPSFNPIPDEWGLCRPWKDEIINTFINRFHINVNMDSQSFVLRKQQCPLSNEATFLKMVPQGHCFSTLFPVSERGYTLKFNCLK